MKFVEHRLLSLQPVRNAHKPIRNEIVYSGEENYYQMFLSMPYSHKTPNMKVMA